MFVPSESVYAEIYDGFDDVVQKAFRARVVHRLAVAPDAGDPAGAADPAATRACARPPITFATKSAA